LVLSSHLEGPRGTLAAMQLLGVPIPDSDARRLATTLLFGDETARELTDHEWPRTGPRPRLDELEASLPA
jgi:hypothetical protein